MDPQKLDPQLRLQVYEAVRTIKEKYECPTLHTESLVGSVLDVITERDGKFYDQNNVVIENVPGYAARRAKWRAISALRNRVRKQAQLENEKQAAIADRKSELARGSLPTTSEPRDPRSALDTRAEIAKLERGECYERLGVTLRQTQRIGAVLRLVLLQGKSYELVHKKLGISKGTVANDVEMGKSYLRTIARKLEREANGNRAG